MNTLNDFTVLPLHEDYIPTAASAEKICLGSEAWSEQSIRETICLNGQYFAIFAGKNFAGHCGITTVLDEGYIINIVILPEFRRKGAATALLSKICAHCRDIGLSFLSLEVRASNLAAIALYEGLGFKVCGNRRAFYKDPTEDALIMTIKF